MIDADAFQTEFGVSLDSVVDWFDEHIETTGDLESIISDGWLYKWKDELGNPDAVEETRDALKSLSLDNLKAIVKGLDASSLAHLKAIVESA